MKNLIQYIILIITLILIIGGCSDESLQQLVSAPASNIERDVKGHEQIYSIQAKLRIGLPHKEDDNYSVYEMWGANGRYKSPPVPIYQEISLSKDKNGNISITSERKHFDVVKSKQICYGLELKYYDVNGSLINHQFSRYDAEDESNSTLALHQHFFTIQNYSLDGRQLIYPMTPDSLYYDDYLFRLDSRGQKTHSTSSSSNNIYIPQDYNGYNNLRYNYKLASKAVEVTHTKDADKPFTDPDSGTTYRMYKTNGTSQLNELTPQLFSYEYRDTDPVEEWLDETVFMEDDLGRFRMGSPVLRLRQQRSLLPGMPYDALGFKGILRFHHSPVIFQMRICICHILSSNGKYDMRLNYGGVHHHNQISPAWNSYDIDYPLPFIIMTDIDGNRQQAIKDIQKYYPEAQENDLIEMFWKPYSYFYRKPQLTM